MAGQATAQMQDWQPEFESLIASLDDHDSDDLFRRLCRHAETIDMDAVEALARNHPDRFSFRPKLAEADYRRTLRKDIAETDRLLGQAWDSPMAFAKVASAPAIALYNRVSDIFDHVDFRDCRRVAVVGCGRLPATMFHIHDRFEVGEIVGLDVVPESVDTANALAVKLGYPRMRVELRDGREYNYSEAQIVFVARMVRSKHAVLARIADTAPPNVQIVMRDPLSVGRLWTEDGETGLDPRLEVFSRGPAGGFGSLSRNLYLRKRAE